MKSHSALIALLLPFIASAQQVRSPDKPPAEDNSVEAELASLKIHPEFSVELFADESLGIANPIAMQWDHRGRLWVLCTLAYAQLKPGEIPDDKLFILEDTDGDHRADKSTLFADGLEMPTGFALAHGGVYIAEGPDLLHLTDTDEDDKCDVRKLILTGFGTGDTHQNISNFVFDSGGFLYFCQGLHAFSHVETPWGVERGDYAGFWRFDPRTTRLKPFCFPSMMSQNPCGIALDRWGALFVKSNGPHLGFATPGLIPTANKRELMQHALIGATPGKSMGVDIVETAHQPDWLQQHAIIAGYFARQVNALPLIEEGAGFETVEPTQLVASDHPSFRPVDIRMGPDGAIYIADWFNPVINHYQVSLRHPHRDYEHGRIWRLVANNRQLVKRVELKAEDPQLLLEELRSTDRWTRDQARSLLFESEREKTIEAVQRFIAGLDRDSERDNLALVEAAGIIEAHDVVTPALLDQLQESDTPQTRAVAARIMGRSADEITDLHERLRALVCDPHPRPRLEAVVALANLPEAQSITTAMLALDSEMDRNIDYALGQAVHALKGEWLPAVQNGSLTFEQPMHLAFVLETHGGSVSAELSRRTLASTKLKTTERLSFLRVLAKHGNGEDAQVVLNSEHADSMLLESLIDAWPLRRVKPSGDVSTPLGILLNSRDSAIRLAALRLAGLWSVSDLSEKMVAIAFDASEPVSIRSAAISSASRLGGQDIKHQLRDAILSGKEELAVRIASLEALTGVDTKLAAEVAVELIATAKSAEDYGRFLGPVLKRSNGAEVFGLALKKRKIQPEQAELITAAMARMGNSDVKLTQYLNEVRGIETSSEKYDAARVKKIVVSVNSGQGDSKRGELIYLRDQLTCVACHQIEGKGGIVGPSLDAVGAGLPLDQIVDSVLYPNRQLKEGYFATSITTVDELVHTGYLAKEAAGSIWIRDTATNEERPISLHQVLKREQIGSLMPPGLTASLSEQELIDLIAYLASLKAQ